MSSSEAARRRLLAAGCALSGGAVLAGCGFQLRQPVTLGFTSAALTGFAPRSPLAEELARALAASGARVSGDGTAGGAQAESAPAVEVVVRALAELREKSVVASTAAAQVREFRLRLVFRLRADTPAGRELIEPTELALVRELSYAESAALAKQHEEAALFRAMQADIVAQVMRRLAAIRL